MWLFSDQIIYCKASFLEGQLDHKEWLPWAWVHITLVVGLWLRIGVQLWDQHWDHVVLFVGPAESKWGVKDGTNSAPCWRQLSPLRKVGQPYIKHMILNADLTFLLKCFNFDNLSIINLILMIMCFQNTIYYSHFSHWHSEILFTPRWPLRLRGPFLRHEWVGTWCDPSCGCFTIWVFPKIGKKTQNGWFIMEKHLLKFMIWGYPYFWKHPYSIEASFSSWYFCRSEHDDISP